MDDRRRPILLLTQEQQKVLTAFDAEDSVTPALQFDFGVLDHEHSSFRALGEAILLARAKYGPRLLIVGGRQAFGLETEDEDPFEEYDDHTTPFGHTVNRYADCAEKMKAAGCDVLLFTRMPSITEARAAILGARRCGLPVWVGADIDREGEDMEDGTDVLATFITLQSLGAAAFGFGRPDSGELILPSLERIAPYAAIPLYARPECLTEEEDGEQGEVMTPAEYEELAERFVRLGVEICGGGFGARSSHLVAVRDALEHLTQEVKRWDDEDDILLCTHNQTFFLDADLDISEPIDCAEDMSEDLLAQEDLGADVLCIRLETPDDGVRFARNSYLLGLPVAFLSDDPETLDRALFYYPGRAALDSRSLLEREELEEIAARYGAVVI